MKWARRITRSGLYTQGKLYPIVDESQYTYGTITDDGLLCRFVRNSNDKYIDWEVVNDEVVKEDG